MEAFEEQIVIKPQPDDDFYVLYSTLHFEPMEWGPRSDYENFEDLGEAFERADRYGSSSISDATFHWSERTIEIRGGWAEAIAPESATAATIERDDLRKLCESDEGAGFSARPQSLTWITSQESVDEPKRIALIPKKHPGGDSLWEGVALTLFGLLMLVAAVGAFPGLSALTTANDWWGTNGGWLAVLGLGLPLTVGGISYAASTIRDRRARERAKQEWLSARRVLAR